MCPRAVAGVVMWLMLLQLAHTNPLLNPVSWAIRTLTDGQEPAYYFREKLLNVFGQPGNSLQSLQTVEKQNRLQEARTIDEDFPCNLDDDITRATEPTTDSVHRLRPADIRVIAALGDSLTAGNGALATRFVQIFSESRGVVWSIGGQGTWREFLTLPNILRQFNPEIIGASLGDGLSHNRVSQFNIADPLAFSIDIPNMARVLVRRIHNDPRVNFYKDWKLVTILVGGNDLCQLMCQEPTPTVWERHETSLREALDFLQRNLPRTLVNLVMVPDVTVYARIQTRPVLCEMFKYLECPCLFSPSRGITIPFFKEAIHRMQKVEEDLVNSGRYNVKDDFTVVLQTFSRNVSFPFLPKNNKQRVTDLTYLSHDCFHFSQKGYAWAANALWNNMLEPVGRKNENFEEPFSRFLCPSRERPYIFTSQNSNVTDIW